MLDAEDVLWPDDTPGEEPKQEQTAHEWAIEEMQRRGLATYDELKTQIMAETQEYLDASREQDVAEGVVVEASPVEQKHIKESNAKLSKDSIVADMTDSFANHYDIITFLNESKQPLMYCDRDLDGNKMPYYRHISRLEAESMAHHFTKNRGDIHHMAIPAVSKTTNSIIDTTEQATLKSGEDRMNGLVCLGIDAYGEPIYYDETNSKLCYGSNEVDRPCFFHLCDTPAKLSGVPAIELDSLDTKTIIEYAKQAKIDMQAYKEDNIPYPTRFEDTFLAWADGDKELYVDLLTVSALPLFPVKPPKIFFALGAAANGKSTWRHLLMTIYGSENTASVSTSQMGDWSYSSTLDSKLINFPDEDDVQLAINTPFFKSIASHDTVNFAKKNSSEPMRIKCDFVSIIPMNREPEWSNMDGGILRRICVLPFRHDFSAEDSKMGSQSFEDRTYTPELIAQLIGEFIGIAQYYAESGTELVFSSATTRANREFVDQHDNIKAFRKEFEKVFVGFTSVTLLDQCYNAWCKANDYKPVDKGRVKMVFSDYTETSFINNRFGRKRIYHPKDTRAIRIDMSTCLTPDTVAPYMRDNRTGETFAKKVSELLDSDIDPVSCALNIAEDKNRWMQNQLV